MGAREPGQAFPPNTFHTCSTASTALTKRARDESSSAATPGGSGLGLAIVASIARLHGGHVKVTSQVGQGSIFEVIFPTGEV
ncbi:MAG: hypothetical protein AUK01_11735 [Anaerolineae bacterium CG2_30_57_67]|nr:MAG: hypothetical protein AUK01_11735 [Anaerolineae bacterium CG2_30_57_67]